MLEIHEQIKLCEYIKKTYPFAIFLSDSSGMRMTVGQALQVKKLRSGNGIPDLIILCPRNGYHGLCIELKKTGEKLYKKDGFTFKTDHLQEQWEVLSALEYHGYVAKFAIGFKEAKKIVDDYFNCKTEEEV